MLGVSPLPREKKKKLGTLFVTRQVRTSGVKRATLLFNSF